MELKEKYCEALRDAWKNEQKMVDYCLKHAAVIKEYDGKILIVSKKSIETSFCFGYGWSGVSNGEEQEAAYNMAEYARKSKEHFIEENIKEINDEINYLKDNADQIYYNKKYWTQSNDNPLIHLNYVKFDHYLDDGDVKAPQEMIDLYIKMLEESKAKFIKRLNTYLKRFGLSKVRAWSYLVD